MRTVGLCLLFVCLGATLTQEISAPANQEWKRFVSDRYLAYKTVFPIQSAQTQASLDGLIKDAVANKNQAVYDLNQKKNDPFPTTTPKSDKTK